MHALQWTCFLLTLLLSTAALLETGHQSRTTADQDGAHRQQPTPASVSASLHDTFTVSAVIGQKAALKCEAGSHARPLLQSWKAETQTKHNCFMSIRIDENKRFENCSEHIKWTPESANYSTLYVNPVGIADDGLYTFETAIPGEGTYSCHITLNVQVPPEVTLITDSSGTAVCWAARGKPAANISWEPACEDCIAEYLPHDNGTVTVTSKYRARSENETGAVCIVSHPTFKVPHNLSGGLSYQESGASYLDTLIIWLSVTICFIITVLTIGFFFYWKPQQLRQCYKFTCGQETSLQRDQHNAEVVEEVEPYASYMQKVNTIYCSITELATEYMPDGSQVELRNYPTKYWN